MSSIVNSGLPADLTERDRWGLWRLEPVGPREAKVPYSVSGRRASTTDPSAWGSWEAAESVLRANLNQYSGLGFLFVQGDGLVGVDLDDVLTEDGSVKEWGRGVVERLADSYMEISPGGFGLKIWLRGALPANLPSVKVGDGAIELYDRARYFTVTGRAFRGAPLEVSDHTEDLLKIYEGLRRATRKTWPLQPLTGGRIPYGQQHSTLLSIAGTLRARRVCDEAIHACLAIVNANQCERPGAPEAIARIVRSTRSWAAR